MCGVVGYVGNVDQKLINRLVEESVVRGTHNIGAHTVKGAGIYHTRYCTSGGDHQPIIKDKYALVMNGVIDMGTKREMELKYKVRMSTDNDAELLLHYLASYSFEEICLIWPEASIAALVLTPKKLLVMRNDKRPLWKHTTKQGSTIFASTKDIFKRAGVNSRVFEVEPNVMHSWTL